MYTSLKNVQVIISLLKKYKIRNLVLSPGSRNVPFVHSVEQDEYFNCYSIVDERSAGYFALGLSEALDEPVLLSCTSATATCNYLPAIEEASRSNIQLIALTADRNPYYREQLENQMIIQPKMYGRFCKKSVDLPTIYNSDDANYCERLVNEALLELNHNGKKGPVQINFPAFSGFTDFSIKKLPNCRVIERLEKINDSRWKEKYERMSKANKVMLLFGEGDNYNEKQDFMLKEMFNTFNCVISVEHMSNIHAEGSLRTYPVTELMDLEEVEKELPEIIITFGNNFSSEYKHKVREASAKKDIEHWRVSLDGKVVDPFMKLNTIFECSNIDFFQKMLSFKKENQKNNFVFYNFWKKRIDDIKLPKIEFSNFYVIKKLTEIIPQNSILHLSILNSIRITNLFDLDPSIKVYANIGAYGIDGSLSTFIGNSYLQDKLSFLIIGDLSFIYDINSTLNSMLDRNTRILIINNYCGGEFHHVYNGLGIKNIDQYIAAGHKFKLKNWCENLNIDYHSASNFKDLEKEYKSFVQLHDKPQILEVFTNADLDTKILHDYFKINQKHSRSNMIIKLIKKALRGIKKICKQTCLKILKILN